MDIDIFDLIALFAVAAAGFFLRDAYNRVVEKIVARAAEEAAAIVEARFFARLEVERERIIENEQDQPLTMNDGVDAAHEAARKDSNGSSS